MHYLLLIGAILWFAFYRSAEGHVGYQPIHMFILALVRFSAQAVTGAQASLGEAAKAVSLSFIFLAITIFTLISFSYSPKGVNIELSGLAGFAVFGATLAAYILGYKLGLGISFVASAIIALISSVASMVAFMLIRGLF